ncbi:hypothetical protein [Pseudobacillus badius]|uniref:hypothetical protein n=1 Tax=Bacillus badius TaxID=1455 RepID=UPI003D33F512
MDLFSTFGIEVEEVKTVMATQKAKANKKKEVTPSTKAQKDTHILEGINNETIVRFSSMNHLITDYFTEDEIKEGILAPGEAADDETKNMNKTVKITKEHLRAKMERDYPELVKDLTHMAFVKEKNMIVVMNAAGKKGASLSSEEHVHSKGPVFWKDGLLFYSNTQKHLRVPESLLHRFIAIARGFALEHKVEVHGDIYYNPAKKEFFLHIPPQTAGSIFVEPDLEAMDINEMLMISEMQKVMEIHSHHIMKPTPSNTDDASERSNIYYAIIGNIDRFFPEIFVRSYNTEQNVHIELHPFLVFEPEVSFPSQHPQVWVVSGGYEL